jgi:hypothetical protein
MRATDASVRIAPSRVSFTHTPDLPPLSTARTRGHGIGASVQLVTTQSQSRNRQNTRSPRRTRGGQYVPIRGGRVMPTSVPAPGGGSNHLID